MNNLIMLPIVVPLLAGVVLIFAGRAPLRIQRSLALLASLATVGISTALLQQAADGVMRPYLVGSWPAPFGIVLMADRLSALFVLLTSVVALSSLLYAFCGSDSRGRYFHGLFQMQVVGINGAFLTGDIFNLFVFFEILLIASYGLLLHGGGNARLKASIHYVVLNLVGSVLFLLGIGVLYGITGTLNMADLALRISAVGHADVALIRAAGLVLLLVFALKAALLPLYFWLPNAYAAASAPVAALFAIMTKVGVYAMLRVSTLLFGAEAGVAANLAEPVILPVALLTTFFGALGALASTELRKMQGYLVIASVGVMLAGMGLFTAAGISAGLYYAIHSTLVMAAMFLLADMISGQRGDSKDQLVRSLAVAQPVLLGWLFFIGAVAAIGLPPLAGFVGKVMILNAGIGKPWGPWLFAAVLLSGLLMLLALARAGSVLFWNVLPSSTNEAPKARFGVLPVGLLLAAVVGLAFFAEPVLVYTHAAATDLLSPQIYVDGVFARGRGEP